MSRRKQTAPILSELDLLAAIERERAGGRTIAFANGCFDVIHVGHIRFLAGAAREGDVLVVGINGDESVRHLKGKGRPFIDANERCEIIAALASVDYVVEFDEDSPQRLISVLKPDVHCKGTDYSEQSVPEGATVRSYGGRVAIVGDPKDHSTTELVSKLRTPQG